MKYIVVYPESHEHLGLFQDLKAVSDVQLIPTTQRSVKNSLIKKIKRIHQSGTINKRVSLPFRRYWFNPIRFHLEEQEEYTIILVDAALKAFGVKQLNRMFALKNVNGVLVLINSIDAHSVSMLEIKNNIPKVNWDRVYTFDPVEAKKYGYQYLGCCYYSKHDEQQVLQAFGGSDRFDAYFTGGIKGGREGDIIALFEKLYLNHLKVKFNLLVSGERRLQKKKYEDQIHYFSGYWMPYEEVLAGILQSNVIIEILQDGQHGPSLRYYEAVCHNKRLLSNNPYIKDLPYYDERYMKVFSSVEDLDIEWIRQDMDVDYHYKGDFSPVYLIEKLKEDPIIKKM